MNALLRPLLSGYLARLLEELRRRGFRGTLLVMQSSGGVAGVEQAVERPAAFIESGPAAGAVAAAYFSRLMGVEHAVGFDMGGTTAKAVAVVGGEPLVVGEYEVGGRAHMGRKLRGSGYPVRYPFIDLVEVSAGGGSIAWVDAGGALRVGPVSAGSDPGPACYGRGGREPTVTDAQLVLGRLPEALAGGVLRLRRDLALEALTGLGEKLGMDLVEAAAAVVRIANTIMARALRIVTVERGYDPRRFTLYAYGGAGPLHAAELAGELGMERVVVPPMPGVFSALGLLLTDYRHDLHAAVARAAGEVSEEELDRVFESLAEKALAMLRAEGVPGNKIVMTRSLEMRYMGQAYSITVPYRGSLGEAVEEFHRLHEARYGYRLREAPVFIVAARLTAYGRTGKPRLPQGEPRPHRPEPRGRRRVYFEEAGWVEAPVYWRPLLRPGAEITGPAVVEEEDSTVLVPPGHAARVDGLYALHIERV
ncbi:hydantoinase/oxoprolinase family protein [Pyrodictium occultum]|uniref:hydantoinase/oxoprolinase family protein n=1 Tax=Pyrodictium occultum TaxID=2309 RepID=UPI001F2818CD|nr:hydantoinase/oxoprolinase family protein [Pyrodictium occultum]